MYNQWTREGKVGQDSGRFLDLSQRAGIAWFFFHKNVSHLLGGAMHFLNVQTDHSVSHVLDCITDRTGKFQLVGCSFPTALCVSAFCVGPANAAVVSSSLFTNHCEDGWEMLCRLLLWILFYSASYWFNEWIIWFLKWRIWFCHPKGKSFSNLSSFAPLVDFFFLLNSRS